MKLIECPRDAMQGIKSFIPTKNKIEYINQLLKVGFDTIDFGSFVSPKAIPQLSDTTEVLKGLDLQDSNSKLLAIVANVKGATIAKDFDEINYLGFPFSISETFQQRNTNSSIEKSLLTVEQIQNICINRNKKLVVYLSMGFGNPYGDDWSIEILENWSHKLFNEFGVSIQAISDTIGVSTPLQIEEVFTSLSNHGNSIEFGAHLHSSSDTSNEKIEAAYKAGCKRFDVAMNGIGGCPMAKEELVGNMSTQSVVDFFTKENEPLAFSQDAYEQAIKMANQLFS